MNYKRMLMILVGVLAVLIAIVASVVAQEETPEPTITTDETPFLGVFYDAQADQIEIEVMRPSPAYAAGLRDGDVITAVNGEPVTPAEFADVIRSFAPNDVITITIERDGEQLDFEVTLGVRRMVEMRGYGNVPPMWEGQVPPMEIFPFEFDMRGIMPMFGGAFSPTQGRLGVAFLNIDAKLAADKGLSVTEGALITVVDPESPAEAAGFMVDDIIIAVNGEPVDEERTLSDRMVAYEAGDEVTFTVLRGEETLELVATLAQREYRVSREMRMMPNWRDWHDVMPNLRWNMFPWRNIVPPQDVPTTPSAPNI